MDIKFRAWEKNLKQIISVNDINFESKMINTCSAWRTFDEIELMQSIGFADINGIEIFTGDIIHCWGGEYCQGYWEHDIKISIINIASDCFMLDEFEFIEIIGNIYEVTP